MLIIYNLFIFFSLNIFLVNSLYIRERKNISIIEFYIIFTWHFLFSLIYFIYVMIYGGDTNGYIEYAKNYLVVEKAKHFALGNGSSLIYNLVNLFVNKFKLDLLNIISIFNFIGFIGLIYLFKTLKNISKNINTSNFFSKNLIYIIIFIPSLSFWSSGIGKEPLVFLSISLFVYGINKDRCNYPAILLSLLILFLVRYQFFVVMFLSTLFIFKINKIPYYIKNIRFIILLLMGFVVVNLFTGYFYDFHIFKLDNIINEILFRQNNNTPGELAANFDINFIQIILNYLFSPIQFKNIFFSITAIENIYIIFLILLLLINFKAKNLKYINLAMLIFVILFLVTMPFATFNLGIAIRQKWVVLVVIFVMLASGLQTYKKNKVKFNSFFKKSKIKKNH